MPDTEHLPQPKPSSDRSGGASSDRSEGRTLMRAQVSAHQSSTNWRAPTVEEVQVDFPGFQILAFVGRGGMGAVYRAYQANLDRNVAIKLLPSEVVEDSDFTNRFSRETQVLRKLHHPNIVAIYDSGVTNTGQPFFVMEFVDGHDLHTLIQHRSLTASQSIRVMRDVCVGIAFAHETGIVHRDLKPANILVGSDGRAKVADFGLARFVQVSEEHRSFTSRAILGTRNYMAPEQHQSSKVDHRCDIYTIGVLLYETVSYLLPQGAYAPASSLAPVGKPFDKIVDRALQPLPKERYQVVHQLLTDLDALPQASSWRPRRSSQALWWTGASVVLCLVSLVLVVQRRTSNPLRSQSAPFAATPTLPHGSGRQEIWHPWRPNLPDYLPDTVKPNSQGELDVHPASGSQWLELICASSRRNQAVRFSYKLVQSGREPNLQVLLRHSRDPECYYSASAYEKNWICTRVFSTSPPVRICKVPRESSSLAEGWTSVEFRVSGTRLTLFENGVLKSTSSDARLLSGFPSVRIAGEVLLKQLEWLDLDEATP